jgi:hypothetical protein
MTHECHDDNCTHDEAFDAALAVIGFVPSSDNSLDAKVRKAASELVLERIERSR